MRGDPNPTGLPTCAIQALLHNLSESVTQLIYILSDEIEKREQADFFDLDAAHSTPVTTGRRSYDISKDYLEHMHSLFFSWEKIADMLHVSVSTLQGRPKEFELSDNFESYSDMTDDELDGIYAGVTVNSSESPLTPNIGRRRFPGRGDSHIKVTGCSSNFLKVTPKRYQDLVLWAWPQVNFNPKRYQNKT